jgi:hypothetical protein
MYNIVWSTVYESNKVGKLSNVEHALKIFSVHLKCKQTSKH